VIRRTLAALALVCAACSSPTYVQVDVEGPTVGIYQFAVTASSATELKRVSVPSVPRPLTLPQTFSLQLSAGWWSSSLTIVVDALDQNGTVLAEGSTNVVGSSGSVAVVSLMPIMSGKPGNQPYPNGVACIARSDCQSGFCVDGVCCDSACQDACTTCTEVGRQGVCSAAGTDPRDDGPDLGASTCGLDGTCDGRGACRLYQPSIPCSASSCNGNRVMVGGLCDGAGSCVPGGIESCSPFLCQNGACHTSCVTDLDCATPAHCLNGLCGAKFNGASCASNSECATGFCTEGVCCNSACQAFCYSCALSSSPGTCSPEPRGFVDVHGRGICGADGGVFDAPPGDRPADSSGADAPVESPDASDAAGDADAGDAD
jgi:hypothetical protein